MKKNLIISIVIFLIVVFTIIICINMLSDKSQTDYYTWTKAICNNYNECADYEIICMNGEMIDMNQLSDRLYMGENWIDRRSEEQINEWCE